MEMSCTDNYCPPPYGSLSIFLSPPEFPPPPPLPSYISALVSKDNLTDSCDLCSKWGEAGLLDPQSSDNFTFVLMMVAIISALSGAGIMAAILSMRRLRRRRSNEDSMRRLGRSKCNEQSIPLPPSRSTNSTPLSNTYCEGPYNDKEYSCNNIYAELHSAAAAGSSDIWRRPPIPTPSAPDNCYLELKDFPGIRLGVAPLCASPLFSSPAQRLSYPSPLSSSTTTAISATPPSYYTDLEVKGRLKCVEQE